MKQIFDWVKLKKENKVADTISACLHPLKYVFDHLLICPPETHFCVCHLHMAGLAAEKNINGLKAVIPGILFMDDRMSVQIG